MQFSKLYLNYKCTFALIQNIGFQEVTRQIHLLALQVTRVQLVYCRSVWKAKADTKHDLRCINTAFTGDMGIGSRTPPTDTQIHRCSNPLYKMLLYLHITYIHPPVYFKSSLNYLQYLIQCERYIALLYCLGINFLVLSLNISDLRLVESVGARSTDVCVSGGGSGEGDCDVLASGQREM